MTNKKTAFFLFFFVATAFFGVTSCTRIPFMPRLEIDSFTEQNDSIETMEVRGVIYVRVVNPQAKLDPAAPPAIWVPAQVYQGGNHTAYTADLFKPAPTTELTDNNLDNNLSGDHNLTGEVGDSSTLETSTSAEEQLSELPKKIPPLRRRALLFPSQASIVHPEITTLLNLELENKLPLRVADCHDQTLLTQGRLLIQRPEITNAIRKWLDQSSDLPEYQFIIFLTASSGRNYNYYTCSWIDVQTAAYVASFSFRENLNGQLLQPLVPSDPVPLLNLVNSTPWWCRIYKEDEENSYQLRAGHRSDLGYGKTLQVFQEAVQIKDPVNHKLLGINFTKPVGIVSIVDFFGDDSSLAQAHPPLTKSFKKAYAVEITEVKTEEID